MREIPKARYSPSRNLVLAVLTVFGTIQLAENLDRLARAREKRVGAPVGVTGKWERPGCLLGIRS